MRTKNLKVCLAALALLLAIEIPSFARVIYVDADADFLSADDGTSWADALKYLQDALMIASAGDEIHVAQGLYTPDDFVLSRRPNMGRAETFGLKNGVAIRGGYAGFGQPNPNARDIELYETILSGDLNGDDGPGLANRNDNAFHVVAALDTNETAVLDGFTVTGGYAVSSSTLYECGGGMYCVGDAAVLNCRFTGNAANLGGGLGSRGPNGLTLTGCTFSANEAIDGAGMYNYSSSPTLTNCTFIANAAVKDGGGMYNEYNSSPTLSGCAFAANTAERYGGAVYVSYTCSAELSQCRFVENSAQRGGAVYSYGDLPTVAGCIFLRNQADYAGAIDCDGDIALSNCLLVKNRASVWGGALSNMENTSTSVNCTFAGNTANLGGAIFSNIECDTTVANSILWDNGAETGDAIATSGSHGGSTLTVAHCDISGARDALYVPDGCTLNWGDGNIDIEPMFADAGDDDFHLRSQAGRWDVERAGCVQDDVTSPCIDAGDLMGPVGPEPFPNGGIVNMGAYGGTAEASKSYFGEPLCETIVAGDINGDCEVNFKDFAFMAFHWLEDYNP